MSESEDENENFCYFGKPLDAYDEDAFPKKRPISVEEQIATDAQGRRRFHGAFTGGFSAGFFNTVGSLEGWTPSEFKSSRSEKSKGVAQKPQDFMDDEDLGEDGIAPQIVRATSDYNSSRKRKKQAFADGPIPGEPVLQNILSSGNETIGYMLLKNLRIKDHRKQKEDLAGGKTYGCQMPKSEDSFQYNEGNQYEMPEIYKDFFAKPKNNTFGLGYSGLDKSHFTLFPIENKAKLVVTDKNNKKLSITGQAFGVGAFEEEDTDIYMKEDMSRYDFELAGEREKVQHKKDSSKLVFDLFMQSNKTPVLKNKIVYAPPTIPHSFTGKHKVRRSRFEPVIQEEAPTTSRINPMIRARYLGEESEKNYTASKSLKETSLKKESYKQEENNDVSPQQNSSADSSCDINSYLSDRFVSSSKKEDVNDILEPVENIETIHGTEQMRDAVRMKMFGPLTRITSDWVPSALLCKRFNVPEPFVDRPEKSRTRTKNIIFEYQKHLEENLNLQPGLKKEDTESPSTPSPDSPEGNLDEKNSEIIEPDNIINKEPSEIKSESVEALSGKPKDITDRIGLENQQDLFKAIFLSSDSESEKEDEIKKEEEDLDVSKDENRKEELKSIVLSDQLIPKIKPMKEGVLSGINFHKFVKPSPKLPEPEKNLEESDEVRGKSNDIGSYGPKVPNSVPAQFNPSVSVISSDSDDEWVEKDRDNKKKKKHKKEKKHKKDKHKKHKHEKKIKHKD